MNHEKQTFSPKPESLSTKAKIALGIGTLAIASWVGMEATSSPTDIYEIEGRNTVEMTLRSGDTLWGIARPIAVINEMDTRDVINSIAEHNNISDAGMIQSGRTIEVPDFSEELEEYYAQIDSNQG